MIENIEQDTNKKWTILELSWAVYFVYLFYLQAHSKLKKYNAGLKSAVKLKNLKKTYRSK